MKLHTVYFRFYGPLNDFLPLKRRGVRFSHTVKGRASVKDTIESLGVVHVEVDAITANARPVGFSYPVQSGDKFGVYPRGMKPRREHIRRLLPKIPAHPRFVADSHLGKLARHLRLLGFDVLYKKIFPDRKIIQISRLQRRIVLTRDIGLLKQKIVRFGYWVRAIDPHMQLKEIFQYFRLYSKTKPFSRCLVCNGKITPVAKNKILRRLPKKVKEFYNRFYMCRECRKIYWRGSHYQYLSDFIRRIKRS